MTKNEFFEKNDPIFLPLGFEKDENDPMFYYSKSLVTDEEIEENDLDVDDVPKLLFGNTGINRGFCIYTGEYFIWINSESAQDAIDFAEKIVAFESV